LVLLVYMLMTDDGAERGCFPGCGYSRLMDVRNWWLYRSSITLRAALMVSS
jgi:hypothetical protein